MENDTETTIPSESQSTEVPTDVEMKDNNDVPSTTNNNQDTEDEESQDEDMGTTVLPIAKVKRILKIDPNYTPTSETTVFMIAKSTELFIKHLAMKAHLNANVEKRKKVQYKDFSAAVAANEELVFLKRMVPPTVSVRKLVKNDQIKYSKSRSATKSLVTKTTKKTTTATKGGESEENKKEPETNKEPVLEKGQQVLNFKRAKTNPDAATATATATTTTTTTATLESLDLEAELVDSDPDRSETEEVDDNHEPMEVDNEDQAKPDEDVEEDGSIVQDEAVEEKNQDSSTADSANTAPADSSDPATD
ncbi:hypothetical protein DASC09_005050 [Saccharomycopsis crataegensis]|uniref:Transcription factor CBF/NF-Y/archaeal histone domain-containing protein n=1 Tax=Saccharomycopsis crataegensis TaxID=43959 RepID=A0AAV5QFE2_9ASCO|nr:hypothetical protein DASC09_005050 [Saccharomycopsis crataegensis]